MEEEAKDIVSEVRRKFAIAEDAKAERTLAMRRNMDYYHGQQLGYISNKTHQYLEASRQSVQALAKVGITLVIKNKIKPAVNVFVSRITQRNPRLYVVPHDDTQQAKDKAKAESEIMEYYNLQKYEAQRNIEIARWTAICGKCYEAIRPVPVMVDGNVARCEIECAVVNPFEFFPCPGSNDIDKLPWIIVRKFIDRKTANDRFGLNLPERGDNARGEYDARNGFVIDEHVGDRVEAIEYLEKPTKKKPKGARCLIVEDKLVEKGEFPYWVRRSVKTETKTTTVKEWGGYRIVSYDYDPSLVGHWSLGLVDAVIKTQVNINMLLSAWVTNRVTTMGVKKIVPRGTRTTETESLNVPSTEEYDALTGEKPPFYLEPPGMPNDIIRLLEELVSTFEEESGVHAISRGEEPEKRLPAIGILHMVDLDMDKFRPIFTQFETSRRKRGKCLLESIQQFCPNFLYHILNENRDIEIREFMGDDLSDFEVYVEEGSSMPESRAARIGILMEMVQYTGGNMLQSRHGMMSWLRAMDTSWSKEMVSGETNSLVFAKDENRRILDDPNSRIPVSEFHDHEIHLIEHSRAFETPDYWKWRGTQAELAMITHIYEHIGFIQQGMAPAPEEQAQMGEGAPIKALPPDSPDMMMGAQPPLIETGGLNV